jgi:cyclopropane fatty-acyl-phospholipid synthase-like methyltransferase
MLAAVDMTEIYSESFWRLFDELDTSLDPAGPDQLYEIADPFLATGHRILDVGCRDARHLIELVRRYDATGVGLDPVPWHVQRAEAAVDQAGFSDRITIRLGAAEDLIEEAASFDTVWCRDVIEVLLNLDASLAQIRRVLRPGGQLIAFTNVMNGPVDAAETVAIHEPLGNVTANLVETELEAAFASAGFAIRVKHVIGTEWRERLEEQDQVVSRSLLRLARLRRTRDRVVGRYGHAAYRTAEASLQWEVHQFLGRFIPVIYILEAIPLC